jgi:arylsulfatase A-like enzyme
MTGVYAMHDFMLGQLLKAAGDGVTVILLSDHGFYCDGLRPKPVEISGGERAAVEAAWHRPFGVLVMAGPGIRDQGERIAGASLLDITPTALVLLGLEAGRDMDGRVLVSAFDRVVEVNSIPSWDALPGESGMHSAELRQDPFESHDALKQLVDLGYMAAPSDDVQQTVDLAKRETRVNLAVVYLTTDRPALAQPIFEDLVSQCPGESRYVLGLARSQYAQRPSWKWRRPANCLPAACCWR